jgi:8-amino-7-oxononanoate synthase
VSPDPHAKLRQALQKRTDEGNLRSLSVYEQGIDFYSNDYLGLANSSQLRHRISQLREQQEPLPQGSTGSRLVSGNSSLAEELERQLADFHGAEAGLLFSSGYAANSGLLASIAGIGDCLIMDELIHASSVDGARLSKANKLIFRHNDCNKLRARLTQARESSIDGSIFVAVESVYSMDGDFAPLRDLAQICAEFGAGLIVDEAHSNGITGRHGTGSVAELGLTDQVFARIHTFGKGLGLHGAIVMGTRTLRQYLVNFCRPFIFSTALSADAILSIKGAYELLPELTEQREQLFSLVRHFRRLTAESSYRWHDSNSWIQSLMIPGNERAMTAAARLREREYLVKAIRAPSVPPGTERIRICLHASNSIQEVEGLFEALEERQCADVLLQA